MLSKEMVRGCAACETVARKKLAENEKLKRAEAKQMKRKEN